MDAIKNQLLKIQQQLGDLSATQKMLTASLLAIMVITVMWWGRYAGTSEMVAVLDSPMSPTDQGQIHNALMARGIPSKIVGDRVMVAADRKMEAVATLTYEDALPSKGADIWGEMSKQMNPFQPKSVVDGIQNHGKELWLSQIMMTHFPGVAKATVVIDPTQERRFGAGASIEPRAAVTISTKQGQTVNVKRLTSAAASTVAYAVAGMVRKNVSVVIDGIPQRVQDPNDSIAGSDLYEQIKLLETDKAEKIMRMLPMGTLVAVTVDLETTTRQSTIESYDKTKSLVQEKSINTNDEDTPRPNSQQTEPGAVSNASLTLGAAPAAVGAEMATLKKSEVAFAIFPGKTTEQVSSPAGKTTVMTAAVRLPKSYFVAKFKKDNPGGKDPDDNALDPLFKSELQNVRDTVKMTVNLTSEESLAVSMYDDVTLPLLAATAPQNSGGSSAMGAVLNGHLKEIVLGALTLLSLFMVSTIVKKGAPAPVVMAAVEERAAPRLGSSEDIAGVAGDGNTTLDGMELDETTVKAQQMVEQVSTMVKENPEAAANLVKRWLNRA